MTLYYQPDHKTVAYRDNLPTQFQCKPRIKALIDACVGELQLLVDEVFNATVSLTVNNATGAQLDLLGRIVGEPRLGLDDEDYRRFIRVRVRANRSSGSQDELIDIFQQMLATTEDPADIDVAFISEHPAGFILSAAALANLEQTLIDRINQIITIAKPAGVQFTLTVDDGTGLIWDDPSRGWDVNNWS